MQNIILNSYEIDLIYLVFLKDDIPLLELDLSVEGIEYNSIPKSGFLTAIKSVSKEISERDVKVINRGNLKIIAEKNQEISVFYITYLDSVELQAKIHSLLELFKSRFRNLYIKDSIDISLFEDFKEVILNFLADDVIKDYYIVKTTDQTPKKSIPGDLWPLISKINDNRNIMEIAKKLKLDLKTIKKKIAFLKSKDLVFFSIYISPYDIPYISPKGLSRLFGTDGKFLQLFTPIGESHFKVIKLIDAKSSVIKLAEKSTINLLEIIEILKLLRIDGYIDILSEELKWCVIYENLYILFSQLIKKFLGDVGNKIFKKILEEEKYPLLRLIKYTDPYTPSFDTIKFHVKNKDKINIQEFHFIFFSPILYTIEKIRPALDLLCSNYIFEFNNGFLKIIEKLKKTYGLKYTKTLKNYFNLY